MCCQQEGLFDLQRPVTFSGTDFPEELVNWLCDSSHGEVHKSGNDSALETNIQPVTGKSLKGCSHLMRGNLDVLYVLYLMYL